jgi:adenylate kinase family enzyme
MEAGELRIAVIGNSGGGKSTLARRLARELEIPVYEVDQLLWKTNWELVSEADYTTAHSILINQ